MAAPAGEKGNEAERRVGWVLEACSRVMRPVVRLALAFGLKHSTSRARAARTAD
jgi:hypothetical protein